MKVQQFNQLKKKVREGNVEGLKKEVIKQLTLKQAQAIEDLLMDLELTDEMNKVLDEVVIHIDGLVEAEKVANKKAPTKTEPAKTEPEKPAKTEKVKPEKLEKPEKPAKKDKEAPKKVKPFNKVNVGDVVKFQVEGEEIKHDIRIIYKGKNNIIAIMADDENEVFNIRKTDFNKQVFAWTDKHGEQYNIIVTL